jgi:CubicO group peptidase (beta-lactamase class C family)
MKNINIFAGILFIVATAVGCRQATDKNLTTENQTPNYDISISTLEDVGLDKQIITELVDSIKTGFYPHRHSLLIYKDDKLVLEEYFSGHDEIWGTDIGIIKHSDTVLHDMRSVSKSVVSACIGIAIEEGFIKDVNQSIFDFFKDYKDLEVGSKSKLTIYHLLTMTDGLDWDESGPVDNTELAMENSTDKVAFILNRDLKYEPGTRWNYNGGTTELLANIILRTTGKNIYQYSKEKIFDKLKITRSEWTSYYGNGIPAAASGLRLTSRGMMKFGILYQNEGKWGEEQIVPKKWVEDSFYSWIERPEDGGYGYQFWILEFNIGTNNLRIPAAWGNGDQRIFFDKKNNLLVITTAGNYNKLNIEDNAIAILKKIYTSFNFTESK